MNQPESKQTKFEHDLECLINRYSLEYGSNTPDFILATFLSDCLTAWNKGVKERTRWYGHDRAVSEVVNEVK